MRSAGDGGDGGAGERRSDEKNEPVSFGESELMNKTRVFWEVNMVRKEENNKAN